MGMTVYHKAKLVNLVMQGLKVLIYNQMLQKAV